MWLFQYNKDWNTFVPGVVRRLKSINVAIPIQQGLKQELISTTLDGVCESMWLFQYNKDWNFLRLVAQSLCTSYQCGYSNTTRIETPLVAMCINKCNGNQCGYSNTTRIETGHLWEDRRVCKHQCGYSNTTRIETLTIAIRARVSVGINVAIPIQQGLKPQCLERIIPICANQCGYSNTTRIETPYSNVLSMPCVKSMWLFQYNKDWNPLFKCAVNALR